jgi:HPt (histidine-containing phosphotransfer) domain-containing protein
VRVGATLQEIAVLFIKESPKMIREIGDAVARRDARALCLTAQTLKGEVANFASSDAVDEASRLEEMGREGDRTGSIESFAILEGVLNQLTSALVRLIESGKRPLSPFESILKV